MFGIFPRNESEVVGGRAALSISSLVAWWDAEVPSSLTRSGSAVSAWRDVVGGVSVSQAFGSARPTYGATSYNGRPGLTFDGSDDELTGGPLAGALAGAATGEMWALVDQTALAADATARSAFTVGNGATIKRELARAVSSGSNRARAATYDGSATQTALEPTVDFSGKHVLRAIFEPTLLTIEIDGVAASTVITVNNTSIVRTRIGANASGTAGNLWSGVINSCLAFNSLLTTDEANRVSAYLNQRRA